MTSPFYTTTDSPLGELILTGDGQRLHGLHFNPPGNRSRLRGDEHAPQRFAAALEQLDEYFAGERTAFELELAPSGSEFQRAVWRELTQIPYGETRSYGEIARSVGQPDAARAVGTANNRNPIAVIIPCHRVIGADGKLVGYAGGLTNKTWLLEHESGVSRLA